MAAVIQGTSKACVNDRLFRVGFCVSGNGSLFRAAAVQAPKLGIIPVIVVAEHTASVELDGFCKTHQISLVRLGQMDRELFNKEVTRHCIEAELDLLCLTFDKLVPAELVSHYRGRIINVHPALLPAFKGMKALEQALKANVGFVGATIHDVDEQMDNGAIIAQCILGVRQNDTTDLVGGRLFGVLRMMYLQVISWYAEGRVYKDESNNIRIKGAVYGEFPVSPAVERSFPD